MKFIEAVGKNYDEALEFALKELGVSKDKVKVEVIEEGSKGLFNLFGVKPTKLKVEVINDYKDNGREFLEKVFKSMNIEADINISEENNNLLYEVSGKNMGSIIGYRGETLDSLQYLLSLVVNKDPSISYKRVILDTENYRNKREETLKRVAEKTASKVLKSRRAFRLEPMNPYERRIIHYALQGRNDITTFSEGEEPHRRIVVDIKRN